MDIKNALVNDFKLLPVHVENIINLIDEGYTIPFIARYRKELTGSLDDQILRELSERLEYLRNLDEKRAQALKLIEEQGHLTDEIVSKLNAALTLTEIDDIYRPFRPKRRTKATIAKEKGLQPLADIIWEQNLTLPVAEIASAYINAEKEVNTAQEALQGAMDIISELISDDSEIRKHIRKLTHTKGTIISKVNKPDENAVYEMYYDYSELVKNIAGHRILALNRGEKENVLSVKIEPPVEEIVTWMQVKLIKKNSAHTEETICACINDSYKRLISPSIEREIRNDLTERAEEGAIKVFSENLRQLLLQPPIKDKVVLAVDPAFRTGCKIAVVDQTGKVLDTTVVYPTPPQSKTEEAKKVLKALISKHNVDIISIGNGTASRESELFIAEMLKEIDKKIYYIIVNEAGASVYSASKLGAEEFPEFDVALRSAVSIGRRLQDPLAELVKIDPKSIGVGQYQHDMNQKRLGEALNGVVEGCVNNVGIDLNTASPSLLSYVSGISASVAKNIIAFREENGKFESRSQLLKVKKLGPKAFEQCAGFLRIPNSKSMLDNTGVHPESYKVAEQLLSMLGFTLNDLKTKGVRSLKDKILSTEETASKLGIGTPTLTDIIKELEKPGRDPREDMPSPLLKSDVLELTDLKEGMVLSGTVRNVIDFGAFIDIGVHQDGLVHISQMADRYIKHPFEVVSVGDIVTVKVLSADTVKKRISLSMRI